ncbi:MAG: hypothetical protein IKD12_03300 [Paludibacteraceae bacterium]|nr:hypothetical protein [Paludibacteraceae bacterium]
MKTTMKIKVMGYRLWVIGMIALLPALAAAVEYKSTYGGAYTQPGYGVAVTTTVPSATFQSTSAYSEQWASREEQPSINEDGSVNGSAYGVGRRPGLRRLDANNDGYDDVTGLPVNPIVDPNDPGNVPLGEALLPLLLMALVYFAIRRKRSVRPSALLRLSLGHGPVMLPFMIA